ncbi:hypothetical protein M426DRAFT_28045 [Hypoxylon sp. CI-4A]|nr:hypothetical protein M426DRAFT_28045 [Hypoxylon sp. CI-4A]
MAAQGAPRVPHVPRLVSYPPQAEGNRLYPNDLIPGGLYLIIEGSQGIESRDFTTLRRHDFIYDLYLHRGGNRGWRFWIPDTRKGHPAGSEIENVRKDRDIFVLVQIEQFFWMEDWAEEVERLHYDYIMYLITGASRDTDITKDEPFHFAVCLNVLYAMNIDEHWHGPVCDHQRMHLTYALTGLFQRSVFKFLNHTLAAHGRVPRISPVGFFQLDHMRWHGFARFPNEWVDVLRDNALRGVPPLR